MLVGVHVPREGIVRGGRVDVRVPGKTENAQKAGYVSDQQISSHVYLGRGLTSEKVWWGRCPHLMCQGSRCLSCDMWRCQIRKRRGRW